MNAAHILANIINSTKPPKHMRTRDSRGRRLSVSEMAAMPKDLNIDRLIAECDRWGADPHEVIARALTDEARVNAEETGMTMLKQAELAWKLVDKANPSQQAIKHSGDQKEPIRLIIEG